MKTLILIFITFILSSCWSWEKQEGIENIGVTWGAEARVWVWAWEPTNQEGTR